MTPKNNGQLREFAQAAQIKFNFQTANLYEGAIQGTRELVERYSNEGIASAPKYARKAADLVIERFHTLEPIIKGLFIDPFDGRRQSKQTEEELREIVNGVLGREVDRALGVMDNLCSSFLGAAPDRYASSLSQLKASATDSQRRLNDFINLLNLPSQPPNIEDRPMERPLRTNDANATGMLDALISEGRLMHRQIVKHCELGPEVLHPQDQISISELDAWYQGISELFSLRFGPESLEYRRWMNGLAQLRSEATESVGRVTPLGGHWPIHNLLGALGLLTKVRLLQFAKLSTDTTSISISSLHPKIAERCKTLFEAREYDSAVLAAFTAVEEAIRERSRAPAKDVGVNLMSFAMNPNSPILKFADVSAEQEGHHALFRGAIGAIKNPLSHRTVGYSDQGRVLELLGFASLLMKLIDDVP